MEQPAQTPNIPSGYTEVAKVPETLHIGPDQLPWASEQQELQMSLCKLQGGAEFLLASALKSHDDLTEAANSMSKQQSENCNNMFYSRVAGFIQNGNAASNVDTFPDARTDFPIRVLRNKGGQRVYFGVMRDEASGRTIILKLGACDKNKQAQVTNVLTSTSDRNHRRKTTK